MEHPLPPASEFPVRRTTASPDETFALGRAAAELLAGGETLLLWGALGAGKTLFVQGVCSGLDVDDPEVNSPTFTLVNTYEGRLRVHHLDLYRLTAEDDLHDVGVEALLDEVEDGTAVLLVEWPDPLLPWLRDRIELMVEPGTAADERTWRLRAVPSPPEAWIELIGGA